MKYAIVIVLLLSQLGLFCSEEKEQLKNHWAVGFLDHKTGLSLFGYARTLVKTPKNDFFIGFGTLVAMNTFSVGWKYNYFESPIQIYSVLSAQAIAAMSKERRFIYAGFSSVGIAREIVGHLSLNFGMNASFRIYSKWKKPASVLTVPHLNLTIKF